MTKRSSGAGFIVCVALLAGGLVAGCVPSRPGLLPVTLPDLLRVDVSVRTQVQHLYADLMQRVSDRAAPGDLAAAYGRLGMVLQAAEYYDAAEPYYLNAQTLDPSAFRWPYYLGLLHTDKGQTDAARADYERVLALRPDDLASLVWLARLHHDGGRPDDAQRLFAKALSVSPRSVAALAGLGQVAIAKRDYAEAVRQLEHALSIDPTADSLHAPLATAYRALGEPDKATAHLARWVNRDILPADPLREELDLVLESGLSYELRGIRALDSRDWTTAAKYFQKGLQLTRDNTPLRRSLLHKYGTALFMAGDVESAGEQFEAAVRLAPPNGIDEAAARAHYSLGILKASASQLNDGVDHLEAAVRYQPNYLEAHVALGDVVGQSGRTTEALRHYEAALRISPRATTAVLGQVKALVELRRYKDARDRLEDAMRLQPDRREFTLLLARLLAAAPDSRARDGERALELAQTLFQETKTTAVGETLAMALAELGDYAGAAAIQRGVMEATRKAGLTADVRRMDANLRLYGSGRPSRTPWSAESVPDLTNLSTPSEIAMTPD